MINPPFALVFKTTMIVLTSLPQVIGILRELCLVKNQSKQVFPHNCLVLSGSGGICANCAWLWLTSANRKRRRETSHSPQVQQQVYEQRRSATLVEDGTNSSV